MTHQMFRDVTNPSITVGGRRSYTVPLSIVAHSVILAALIVMPLLATGTLPLPPTALSFISATPTLPLPPAAPRRTTSITKAAATVSSDAAPIEAPHQITPESIVPGRPQMAGGFETSGGTIPNGLFVEAAIPPPPAAVSPASPSPVRPGGNIRPPTKVRDAAPAYPPIAAAGRVEGIVIIEATISAAGKVQDAKVLRSVPLLDAAALEAVRQWEYLPTLLNGTPIPIIITVTVAFKLR